MDLFKAYATDESRELNGTWTEIAGYEFLIARSNNRNYVKALTKAIERNQKLLDRKDEAADKKSDEIMVDVIATTILLGWRRADKPKDETIEFNGESLAYSVDNAKKLLALKDFRRDVMRAADDFDAYKVSQAANDEKN